MRITVKLFATLRAYGPPSRKLEVQEGGTLADLVKTLLLPEDIPLVMIVNGLHARPSYILREGDEIAFFPPIAGG
jgi:molybdopterin converting factor small subunit